MNGKSRDGKSMDDSTTLDRRIITGDITMDMPSCVLMEVARSFRLKITSEEELSDIHYRLRVTKSIDSINVSHVRKPYSKENLTEIAKFVNPDPNIKWKYDELMVAFNWLVNSKINHKEVVSIVESGRYAIGDPVPGQEKRVNACILYSIIMDLKILVNHRTTASEMKSLILLQNIPREPSIDNALLRMAVCSPEAMANVLNVLCKDDSYRLPWKIDSVELESVGNFILQKFNASSLKNLNPASHTQAVILGLINYGIDLSYSDAPLIDYDSYSRTKTFTSQKLKSIFALCKAAFDMSSYFNPNIPLKIYSRSKLETLSGVFGIPISGMNFHHEMVCASYTDNFLMGIHPGVKELKTKIDQIDLEDYEEAKNFIYITYGSYTSKFTVYTSEELESLFSHNLNFSVPTDPTDPADADAVFTPSALKNLKRICTSANAPGSLIRLYHAIMRVEAYQSSSATKMRELISVMNSGPEENKQAVIKVLYLLRDFAFILRGWKGVGPLPVKIAINKDEFYTDITGREKILTYRRMISELGKMGNMLENLPLVEFKDLVYQASKRDDIGKTIKEKIDLIDQGMNTPNINSCIRLSSNWLCATVHLYLVTLGIDPGFRIEELRAIQ